MNRIAMIKKIAKAQEAEERRVVKPNSRENRFATRLLKETEEMSKLEYDGGTLKRYKNQRL